MYIIELQKDCYIADWDGDPGRTTLKENAKRFNTFAMAERCLNRIKSKYTFRCFRDSKIIEE